MADDELLTTSTEDEYKLNELEMVTVVGVKGTKGDISYLEWNQFQYKVL